MKFKNFYILSGLFLGALVFLLLFFRANRGTFVTFYTSNTSDLMADLTLDECINISDFVVWVRNYKTTREGGTNFYRLEDGTIAGNYVNNGNPDGVDIDDFLDFKKYYGQENTDSNRCTTHNPPPPIPTEGPTNIPTATVVGTTTMTTVPTPTILPSPTTMTTVPTPTLLPSPTTMTTVPTPTVIDPVPTGTVVPPPGGAMPTPPGSKLPLFLAQNNYKSEYGPSYVYAWLTDASMGGSPSDSQITNSLMSQLRNDSLKNNSNVVRLVSISSTKTMRYIIENHGDEMKSYNIHTIGYNMERAVGTPDSEINTIRSGDPNVNSIALAAKLAEENGFWFIWGPIRSNAGAQSATGRGLPDSAIKVMIESGLDGVGFQEQKFVEPCNDESCISGRVNAVKGDASVYKKYGGEDFHVDVQIMSSRCPSVALCKSFVRQINDGTITSLAIWASGGDRQALPGFIEDLDDVR